MIEDPHEKINLAPKFPEKVGYLKQKIEDWYPLKYKKLLKVSDELKNDEE